MGECELIHIFYVREKATIIMLKILGATIQNLFVWVTRCLWCVYPCPRLQHGIAAQRVQY